MNTQSAAGNVATIDIPPDILDLVTEHGANELPQVAPPLIVVRLRAYWGRIADLASGRTSEADRWLHAYRWAIEQEHRLRSTIAP